MNICIRGIDCASCWNLELFRMCGIFSNFHFIISNYRMAEYNRLYYKYDDHFILILEC